MPDRPANDTERPPGAVVRPFARSDRDQLTELINRHIRAVTPGVSLSVNAVLAQMEREPNDLIVDPWVAERRCLVAERDERVVVAALLHRFADDERVRPGYRNAGEIRYLVCDPGFVDAGVAVAKAALGVFGDWGVGDVLADGSLPAMACVGVPDVWPHIREIYLAAEFEGPEREDIVHVAACGKLAEYRVPGLTVTRSLGPLGTVLTLAREAEIGSIEVCQDGHGTSTAPAGSARWADVGNLTIAEGRNPRLVGPALYGEAARWLLRGGVDQLVDYRAADVPAPIGTGLLLEIGFEILCRNGRGWRQPRSRTAV